MNAHLHSLASLLSGWNRKMLNIWTPKFYSNYRLNFQEDNSKWKWRSLVIQKTGQHWLSAYDTSYIFTLNKIFSSSSLQLIAKVWAETWDRLLLCAKTYDKLLTWQSPCFSRFLFVCLFTWIVLRPGRNEKNYNL